MKTVNTESKIPCLVCGKELDNWVYESRGGDSEIEVHPMDGLQFRTYGHYGSTIFDPMDGTFLDIAICDPCIMKNANKVRGSGKKDLIHHVDILVDAMDRHG